MHALDEPTTSCAPVSCRRGSFPWFSNRHIQLDLLVATAVLAEVNRKQTADGPVTFLANNVPTWSFLRPAKDRCPMGSQVQLITFLRKIKSDVVWACHI
jgi:hypothetical protein